MYPEIQLQDFSGISIDKKTADIKDADIDKMIATLQEQRRTFQKVDRASQDGDQLNIDFTGTVDGEKFEGGQAKGSNLILGSKRMIPGFEEGLVSLSAGEEKTLSLTFPEQYHNQDLAGKAAEFVVKINEVREPVLPALDEDFFASFDVKEGGIEAFRKEVSSNMARELKNAVRNNVKNQVIDGLLKIHEVEVPQALIGNEVRALRQQAIQQFGGGRNIDPAMLPDELFADQAKRRVSLSLIMSEIISKHELKPRPEAVRALIEEMAESYEKPEEVIKWYYSDKNQLANVEAMALEDAVIDLVAGQARINEKGVDYEEALKPSTADGANEQDAG